MALKLKNKRFVLAILAVIFLVFMYSCADRLCSAYTGQAYIGHGPQSKPIKR